MSSKSRVLSVHGICTGKKGLRKQSAFGLVETILSLFLLAGFLLSTLHLLLSILSSNLLDQTSTKLIDSFKFARQVAIESNSKVIVKPVNNSWSAGWQVISGSNSQEKGREEQNILFLQAELNEAVMFLNQNELSIVFNPNGMTSNLNPLGEDGLIFCNVSGKGRQLTMLASGQVHITHIKQDCGAQDV